MSCAVCGAPADRSGAYCVICGHAHDPEATKKWDRTVEAFAIEDLQTVLKPDEALLGSTRGRIAGSWRRKLSLNPQTFLSPFVNLGLTGERLILQQIQQGNGRAASEKITEFPLSDVVSIAASDADPMESGRSVRLAIVLNNGESFRIRAAGRLASAAQEIVEVWGSLASSTPKATVHLERCASCERTFDLPHRFCPFCGKEQGDA
jgi:hypothetical protein